MVHDILKRLKTNQIQLLKNQIGLELKHQLLNFLRKPNEKNLTSKARILKLGKTLSVGDVLIYSEDIDEPVAHASLTYSIPQK